MGEKWKCSETEVPEDEISRHCLVKDWFVNDGDFLVQEGRKELEPGPRFWTIL